MRLLLPDPCLVVLVGAAGSGKSTLAARLFPPETILSSDALRGVVAGDPADQAATRTVFSILNHRLARRMAERRTTVIDATSVTAHARRSLVARAAGHGIPAVAIVLDLGESLVLARNATRAGRIVPEAIVRRHLGDLQRSLRRGLDGEGFAEVLILRTTSQVAELEVTFRSGSTPAGARGDEAKAAAPSRRGGSAG